MIPLTIDYSSFLRDSKQVTSDIMLCSRIRMGASSSSACESKRKNEYYDIHHGVKFKDKTIFGGLL